MRATVKAELLKLRRSQVGVVATIAIVMGVLALLAGITIGIRAGNPQLVAKAGPAVASLDWTGLLLGAYQIISVAGLLGFGVVLSWIFGREFTDGTISGLFGLPTSGKVIAGAKLIAYLIWVVVVSGALTAGIWLFGVANGYGFPPFQGLIRLLGLCFFSAMVAMPVAWLTTLCRSVFAGVGVSIGLVITAQVGVLVGIGRWFPLVAPALWALAPNWTVAVTVVPWAAVFAALCRRSWKRLTMA